MYERKGLDLESQKAVYSEWVAWRGLISREKYEEAFGKGYNDKIMHCGPKKHILVSRLPGSSLALSASAPLRRRLLIRRSFHRPSPSVAESSSTLCSALSSAV